MQTTDVKAFAQGALLCIRQWPLASYT